ncbi:uncharacterized protein LOC123665124 [Melitaea cinxia]|uniref:uncharacterized protein LOC123665124 n=1 Tax=Melitaea cinxia TaxID=113334 RepID=UPI001E273067|nr:uncharacterized protein LOC123665124 [Melitaea cinxia]
MSDKQIKHLIKKRAIIKGKLTGFSSYLKSLANSKQTDELQTQIELQLRLDRIESLYDDFDAFQSELDELSDMPEDEAREREAFYSQYYSLVSAGRALIQSHSKLSPPAQDTVSPVCSEVHSHRRKVVELPKIDLPHFNGEYQYWLGFRDTFNSLIHSDNTLDNVNKFHYLRASLKGNASLIISGLDFCADNYEVAWKTLCERYDNKRLLENHHLNSLFKIGSIQKESSVGLRNLIDTINKNLRALSNLGQPVQYWDTLIIFMMSSKLDNVTNREWEFHRNNYKNPPTLENFTKFLSDKADLLETLDTAKMDSYKSDISLNKSKTFAILPSKSLSCPLCKKGHALFQCESFRMLPVEMRIQRARAFGVCLNCLRFGHTETKCKSSHCKYCTKNHNTLLHTEESPSQSVALSSSEVHSNSHQTSTVLLSTALVKVLDINGKPYAARILLDNGSTNNFITLNFAGKLRLNTISAETKVSGINNQLHNSSRSCSLTLESYFSDYRVKIDCIILPTITTLIPSTYVNLSNIQIPSGVALADPSFHIPSVIDILVGAEIFWNVIGTNRINLGKNKPTLFETKLGWLVSGSIIDKHYDNDQQPICMLSNNLEFDLTRFWELDSVSSKHIFSPEERACEEHFVKTTKRKADGRFVVTLPLKESPTILGDSYHLAERRFLSLERRLDRDTTMKQLYMEFMKEYLALGHMTESQTNGTVSCYLPHHGVLRESSSTTKLRVVFDASAVTTSGVSLNDILRVGPTLQDDLLSILLRFRQHKYVVTADIEKMYRQTEVCEHQRALQQILWRFHPSHPIKRYQLNTVTYGTSSASFLATRCLHQLGRESADPDIKRAICKDFYVDDFLSGHNTITETILLCQGVSRALTSAQLNLRKWHSNNNKVLLAISGQSDVSGSVDLSNDYLSKTLGLYWTCSADTLSFPISIQSKDVANKRFILSTIAQIFDPLGLVAPSIVEAKLLMQQLWKEGCSWDEPVPAHIGRIWSDFVTSLPTLKTLSIPRCVISQTPTNIQLHIFTDASERAYGACIYIRCLDVDGTVSIRLLASKSKVAPLKTVSIPRLELCSVLLGVRLGIKILESLTITFNKCILWSDSTIVLCWLRSSPGQLKPFVRHRVSEIQEGFSNYEWRYIPSKDNPADIASRGLRADILSKSSLWWSGPSFLQSEPRDWPIQPKQEIQFSDLPETIGCLHVVQESNIFTELITRFSVFSKLQRVVSFIFRFINNCRGKSEKLSGNITIDELGNATNFLLRIAQQDSFLEEYQLLINNQNLPYKNRLLSLSPFIDDNKLMRVGGRLANTNYDFNVKHPILLCSRHPLCRSLFVMLHIKYLHSGPQLLLATVRHNYWVLGGTKLAKSVVRSCVKCCRLRGKTLQPIMGNLPQQRVTLEFPFLDTGVDYAGPVMIANHKGKGCRHIKSYICVFVCLATKALHLELVSDLTKEAFIAALNRFISRRGKPRNIYSDNGTTFVGTFHELSTLLKRLSPADTTEEGIRFTFIPAYAPHFGGLWESAVKSVKHHLRRVLSLTFLDYEEMNTLLIQVEAILNSRPLTPLSDDPSDLCPLTPAHLLIGRSLLFAPQSVITVTKISSLARFNRIQVLKQHFWNRFSNEYVTLLQQKTKWMQSQETLKEGALVVIKDKSSQPIMWLLGRILRVLPGEDGVARVADIRTRKGVIRRAFNMICPLPTVNIEEDSSTRGVCMSTCAPDDRVGRGRREGAGSAGDDASAAPTY